MARKVANVAAIVAATNAADGSVVLGERPRQSVARRRAHRQRGRLPAEGLGRRGAGVILHQQRNGRHDRVEGGARQQQWNHHQRERRGRDQRRDRDGVNAEQQHQPRGGCQTPPPRGVDDRAQDPSHRHHAQQHPAERRHPALARQCRNPQLDAAQSEREAQVDDEGQANARRSQRAAPPDGRIGVQPARHHRREHDGPGAGEPGDDQHGGGRGGDRDDRGQQERPEQDRDLLGQRDDAVGRRPVLGVRHPPPGDPHARRDRRLSEADRNGEDENRPGRADELRPGDQRPEAGEMKRRARDQHRRRPVAVDQAALDRARGTGRDQEGARGGAGEGQRAARLPDDEDDPEPRGRLGELRHQPGCPLPERPAVAQETRFATNGSRCPRPHISTK